MAANRRDKRAKIDALTKRIEHNAQDINGKLNDIVEDLYDALYALHTGDFESTDEYEDYKWRIIDSLADYCRMVSDLRRVKAFRTIEGFGNGIVLEEEVLDVLR